MTRSILNGPPGLGTPIFSNDQKEEGRRMAFKPEAVTVYKEEKVPDGGGDYEREWVPIPEYSNIRGRIDQVGRRQIRQTPVGGRINEATTHIVSLDPDVPLTPEHRIEIEGKMWIVIAVRLITDAPSIRAEVREV